MTTKQAVSEIELLIPQAVFDKAHPIISEWLAGAAEKVAIETGAYRQLLTVTSSGSVNYVDLKNGGVYDMLFPYWATYDGVELHFETDREALEEREQIQGFTPSDGTPASCALDNPNNPTQLLFNCPCSDARTVKVYYAAKTTTFQDLPTIWHRSALPFAKARAMELSAVIEEDQQKSQKYASMAEKFDGQFEKWVTYLVRQINFSQSKLDRTRVRSGWLTGW